MTLFVENAELPLKCMRCACVLQRMLHQKTNMEIFCNKSRRKVKSILVFDYIYVELIFKSHERIVELHI